MKRLVSLLLSFTLGPWSFSLSGCAPEDLEASMAPGHAGEETAAYDDATSPRACGLGVESKLTSASLQSGN